MTKQRRVRSGRGPGFELRVDTCRSLGRSMGRWFVVVVAGFALAACRSSTLPAATSAEPSVSTAPASPSAPASSPGSPGSTSSGPLPGAVTPDPEMFTSVVATVVDAAGDTCELCVWLADTDSEWQQGMKGVTDLGGRDAMVFAYSAPRTTQFWMKDTVLPLSIAFFGGDGRYIEAFDMELCASDPCRRYPTPADFTVAVEVLQGDLATLGIEPGATIAVSDIPCARTTNDV